jgi:hypothetical protein
MGQAVRLFLQPLAMSCIGARDDALRPLCLEAATRSGNLRQSWLEPSSMRRAAGPSQGFQVQCREYGLLAMLNGQHEDQWMQEARGLCGKVNEGAYEARLLTGATSKRAAT